ncbi:MAG: hypothetical protein Q7S87_03095 [Agitococcus sp.]|nr:hypothetical protein [Agitococcus sp.]MDO9177165.1 hypothetical protein [Agitococcus sp.]
MTVISFKSARTGAPKKRPKKKNEPIDVGSMVNASLPGMDIDYSLITRNAPENGPANGDNNDMIVSRGAAEDSLRKLTKAYGFSRLPFTWGELQELVTYCNILDSAICPDLPLGPLRESWHQSCRKTIVLVYPDALPALNLFIAGDLAALTKWHTAENTLTKLGLSYLEFE